jgi:hypothetical protein
MLEPLSRVETERRTDDVDVKQNTYKVSQRQSRMSKHSLTVTVDEKREFSSVALSIWRMKSRIVSNLEQKIGHRLTRPKSTNRHECKDNCRSVSSEFNVEAKKTDKL